MEVVNSSFERGQIRFALFDFDGTLSLIREGWQQVMIPMMVEILAELETGESVSELTRQVTEYVDLLTGKQTIYQMIRLCEEIKKRGGEPRDPLDYKRLYHHLLWDRINHRVAGLKEGRINPKEMVVPGSFELLDDLRNHGITCYLASGTDLDYVKDEAKALGMDRFFGERIFGALDDYKRFSKKMVIENILQTYKLQGNQLVGFGDGYVEIENIKEAGGIAVGVASDETNRSGINEWKRTRLINAGADIILPDFREEKALLSYLFIDKGGRSVTAPEQEIPRDRISDKHVPYRYFDRARLKLRPLQERLHDMTLDDLLPLDQSDRSDDPSELPDPYPLLVERIRKARSAKRPVILMMGAHVIKVGLSRFIIDLMERGLVTHVGTNGAGAIHDFELALIGRSTESVARYIRTGEFGLWQETGRINDAAKQAASDGLGFGEAVGRMIETEQFPHRNISIFAAGYRLQIPVTVHVGIGYDIVHEHPNCDGAAVGAASYRDFLIMTQTLMDLEGGVFLNFGSAVMGPEVYLKALSMARNVARQAGQEICHFTTAVFDLHQLESKAEALDSKLPSKAEPAYYYRPWKTILVRTVQDGGESFYVQGDHRVTLSTLYRGVVHSE